MIFKLLLALIFILLVLGIIALSKSVFKRKD